MFRSRRSSVAPRALFVGPCALFAERRRLRGVGMCLMGVLLLLSGCAAAPVATPESTLAARQFLSDNHMAMIMTAVLAAKRDAVVAQTVTATGKPKAQVADMVDRILIPTITAHMDELVDIVGGIYARDFSADELWQFDQVAVSPLGQKMRNLMMPAELAPATQTASDRLTLDEMQRAAALNASPAFQKLQRLTPAIQQEIAAASRLWMQRLLQDELRQQGFGNRLAA